jgi:protein-disulfide isomerase
MEVLKENKDVRLVFKEYPILGEPSYLASSTALAINDKMKYLTYHSKLMTHSGRATRAVVEKILSEMKLPPQKLQSEARSDKYVLQLAETRQLADALGISGTPAFIINGQLFPGALDKADLTQAVKTARANLKAK